MDSANVVSRSVGGSPNEGPDDRKSLFKKPSATPIGGLQKVKTKVGRPLGSKNKSSAWVLENPPARAPPVRPALKYHRRTQQHREDHRGKIISFSPQQGHTAATQTYKPVHTRHGPYPPPTPPPPPQLTSQRHYFDTVPGNPYPGFAPLQSDGNNQVAYEGPEAAAAHITTIQLVTPQLP